MIDNILFGLLLCGMLIGGWYGIQDEREFHKKYEQHITKELHYKDKVKVVNGFYKGCTGIAVDKDNHPNTYTIMNLHCLNEDLGIMDISSSELELQ